MTRDQWEALADILGEPKTLQLYGPPDPMCWWPDEDCACPPGQGHNEALNSAESVQRLYVPTGGLVWSPRVACWVAGILAVLAFGIVAFAAIHHRDTSTVPTELEPCALVLTRSGQVCR